MKLGEFMLRTGVSKKTARNIYTMLHREECRSKNAHRNFTENDVMYINSRKLESYIGNIKQIKGFENYYITDDGRVFCNSRNFLEEIRPYIAAGYRYVTLYNNGCSKHYKISKLVALYFVPNPNCKEVPNHKDGNKLNDNFWNLEWVTYSENTKHAFGLGLAKNAKGEEDSQSKPVDLYTNSGVFICHYGSISEASRELGLHKSKIARQAKNESFGQDGFCFRYSNK